MLIAHHFWNEFRGCLDVYQSTNPTPWTLNYSKFPNRSKGFAYDDHVSTSIFIDLYQKIKYFFQFFYKSWTHKTTFEQEICSGFVWKVTIHTCDSTLIPEFTFIQKSLGIRHHACNFIIIGFCTSPRKAWCLLCPRSTPNIHWPTGVCPSTYHNYEGKK